MGCVPKAIDLLRKYFQRTKYQKQLPSESQTFEKVDQFFKALMFKTKKSPNAIKTLKLHSNLLEQLKVK